MASAPSLLRRLWLGAAAGGGGGGGGAELAHRSRFPGAQKKFGKIAVKVSGPSDLDSIFRAEPESESPQGDPDKKNRKKSLLS